MDTFPNDPLSDELSLVKDSLSRWAPVAGGQPELINLSENHTFRIDGSDGSRHVLRLHPLHVSGRRLASLRPAHHRISALDTPGPDTPG